MFSKVKRKLKRAMVKAIRAREERAAAEVARYLIKENRDFQNMSLASLTKAIASRKKVRLEQVNGL